MLLRGLNQIDNFIASGADIILVNAADPDASKRFDAGAPVDAPRRFELMARIDKERRTRAAGRRR